MSFVDRCLVWQGDTCAYPVIGWDEYMGLYTILSQFESVDNVQLLELWRDQQGLPVSRFQPAEKRAFQKLLLALQSLGSHRGKKLVVPNTGRWSLVDEDYVLASPVPSRLDEHGFANFLSQKRVFQFVYTTPINKSEEHEPEFIMWGTAVQYASISSDKLIHTPFMVSSVHSTAQECRDELCHLLLKDIFPLIPKEFLNKAPVTIIPESGGVHAPRIGIRLPITFEAEMVDEKGSGMTLASLFANLTWKQRMLTIAFSGLAVLRLASFLIKQVRQFGLSMLRCIKADFQTVLSAFGVFFPQIPQGVKDKLFAFVQWCLTKVVGVYVASGSPGSAICHVVVERLWRFFHKFTQLRAPCFTVLVSSMAIYLVKRCYNRFSRLKSIRANLLSSNCIAPFTGQAHKLDEDVGGPESVLRKVPNFVSHPVHTPSFVAAVFCRDSPDGPWFGNGVCTHIISNSKSSNSSDKKQTLLMTGHQLENCSMHAQVGFAPLSACKRGKWDLDKMVWEDFNISSSVGTDGWEIDLDVGCGDQRQHLVLHIPKHRPFFDAQQKPDASYTGRDLAVYTPKEFPKGLKTFDRCNLSDSVHGGVTIWGVVADDSGNYIVQSSHGNIKPGEIILGEYTDSSADGQIVYQVEWNCETHLGILAHNCDSRPGFSGSPIITTQAGRSLMYGVHSYGCVRVDPNLLPTNKAYKVPEPCNYGIIVDEVGILLDKAGLVDNDLHVLQSKLMAARLPGSWDNAMYYSTPCGEPDDFSQVVPTSISSLETGPPKRRQGKSAWRRRRADDKAFDALDPEQRKQAAGQELAHIDQMMKKADKSADDMREIRRLEQRYYLLKRRVREAESAIRHNRHIAQYAATRAGLSLRGRPMWTTPDEEDDPDDIGSFNSSAIPLRIIRFKRDSSNIVSLRKDAPFAKSVLGFSVGAIANEAACQVVNLQDDDFG